MKKKYAVLDPTGNITALAEMTAPELRAETASAIMAKEPAVEQVGFVAFPKTGSVELQMAGGEFCGNATLCAGILGCVQWKTGSVQVRASGAEQPLTVSATRVSEDTFDAEGELPLPISVAALRLPAPNGEMEVPVARFSGISHAIVTQPMQRETAERLVREWCGYLQADGMGILFWNEAEQSMKPLVYVPSADTLFWESSCASGSAAVGAWLSQRQNAPVTVSIRQPGGTLEISASNNRILLRERVRIRKGQ